MCGYNKNTPFTPFQAGQFTTHVPAAVLAELSSLLDCADFGPFAHRGLPQQQQSFEANKDSSRVVVTTDAYQNMKNIKNYRSQLSTVVLKISAE